MSNFSRSKDVKTRKPHRCDLCSLEIPKGVFCHYSVGVQDGSFYSNYDHKECFELWIDLNADQFPDDWDDLIHCIDYQGDFTFKEWQERIRTKYGLQENQDEN